MYAPVRILALIPAASRMYSTEETAEDAMAPQTNKWKLITWTQVDVPAPVAV